MLNSVFKFLKQDFIVIPVAVLGTFLFLFFMVGFIAQWDHLDSKLINQVTFGVPTDSCWVDGTPPEDFPTEVEYGRKMGSYDGWTKIDFDGSIWLLKYEGYFFVRYSEAKRLEK